MIGNIFAAFKGSENKKLMDVKGLKDRMGGVANQFALTEAHATLHPPPTRSQRQRLLARSAAAPSLRPPFHPLRSHVHPATPALPLAAGARFPDLGAGDVHGRGSAVAQVRRAP